MVQLIVGVKGEGKTKKMLEHVLSRAFRKIFVFLFALY